MRLRSVHYALAVAGMVLVSPSADGYGIVRANRFIGYEKICRKPVTKFAGELAQAAIRAFRGHCVRELSRSCAIADPGIGKALQITVQAAATVLIRAERGRS